MSILAGYMVEVTWNSGSILFIIHGTVIALNSFVAPSDDEPIRCFIDVFLLAVKGINILKTCGATFDLTELVGSEKPLPIYVIKQ